MSDPLVLVENIEDLTQAEWLATRKKGIGGSDVGKLFDVNPYATKIELYWDKVGEKPVHPMNASDPIALEYGHHMEPFILKLFAARNPEFFVYTKRTMFQHPDYPWMLADCDAFAVDKRTGEIYVVEIKTTTSMILNQKWGAPAEDLVPESYEWQGCHYVAVTGAVGCIFVCLGGNNESFYRQRVRMRDPEKEAEMIEVERDFWQNHVEKHIPPADMSGDPKALLRAYQAHYGATSNTQDAVDLTEEFGDEFMELVKLDNERKALERDIAALQEKCDKAKAVFVNALEGRPGFVQVGQNIYDITTAPTNRRSIPVAAFPELLLEYPEAEKYIKVSDSLSTTYKLRKKKGA